MRIQFMLGLPDVTVDDIREAMVGFLDDPKDVDIMVLMYQTTCQSEVAERLNVTQGLVRHRFMRAVQRMSQAEHMCVYWEVFDRISKNLNILREVQRASGGEPIIHMLE